MRRAALLACASLAFAACRGPGTSEPQREDSGIELEIAGNESFETDELEEFLRDELEKSARPSKADVDDAAFALELFYLARGFHEARVDYEYEDPPGERVRARIEVFEGQRARIRGLVIHGNASIEDERLRELLDGATEGSPYVQSAIDAGLRRVRELYLEGGFLHVIVAHTVEGLDSPDGAVLVLVEVEEGPGFRVREIDVEGGLAALESAQKELADGFLAQPYTPRLDYALRARLLELYGRSGWPECVVEVESTLEESGAVDLRARVRPGPRVRIGALVVRGNQRTREKLIRERIELGSGDVYDSEKIRESFQALYATGLFESVRIELEPRPAHAPAAVAEEEERLLHVDVVEASTLDVEFEVGWGSYEGPRVAVRVDEKNLFGTGLGAFADSKLSFKDQRARIGLIDRDLFGTPISGETSVFASRREEPAFTSSEVGVGAGARYRWDPRWTGSTAYEIRRTQLDDVDVDLTLDPDALEDTDIATISFGVVRETRDNVLLPERGSRARAGLTWAANALGSEIDFLRGELDLMRIVPLGERFQIAGSARTGLMAPLAETEEIPLQERFFNGGENTVRSFQEDQLGPKDASGTPVGGEAYNALSLELRAQIVGHLAGALFYDTGNVTLDHKEYFEFEDFRTGIGAGLRYLLPIGPVRLDLGYNPSARDDEDDFVLHFSVGFPY